MEVFIIQPPSTLTVLLDQTGGRASHLCPPWHAHCLQGFLVQRTRHAARVFDARVRRRWEQDLERHLKEKISPDIAVIACGMNDVEGIKAVVAALRRLRPNLPLAGFGDLPTRAPQDFREKTGMDFGIVGDPEPTLRHLLDNFHIAFRRQRIAALLQDGVDAVAPLWAGDLKGLALPAWDDVSFAPYDSPAHPGGSRVDVCMSRGAGQHAVDQLARPDGAPLRIGAPDQFSTLLQGCTHLGILDVHFTDPPDVWDGGVLEQWLDRLDRVRNTQDWSLRLLAMPLGEKFRARLAEQHCRRIELLVPSCHRSEAARLGYDQPDPRDLLEMSEWFAEHDVTLDFIFWIGGTGEPRGEARRIMRFIRALHFPAFALETRPDISPADPRALAVARDVRRSLALSPTRRIRSLFGRLRSFRVTIDVEHRDLITRQRPAAQTHAGDASFQSLENDVPQASNDWKS